MKIGSKISGKRKELGITQIELAEKMCVTRQAVSRWESGAVYPDIEKIPELAEILGVSCDYLLTENEETGEAVRLKKPEPPSRLMQGLVGKKVEFEFYDDEYDVELSSYPPYTVDSFDGSWFKVTYQVGKQTKQKLVSISSVLSVEIIGEVQ